MSLDDSQRWKEIEMLTRLLSIGIGLNGIETHSYRVPIFNGTHARARFSMMPPHPQLTAVDSDGMYRILRVSTVMQMQNLTARARRLTAQEWTAMRKDLTL